MMGACRRLRRRHRIPTSRARTANTAPPMVPPNMAPTWEADFLWLVWPLVESEPEMMPSIDDDEGEGERARVDDWLETEVEIVSTRLEVTNVPKLVGVLVDVVDVAPSPELAVAREDAVLVSADVVVGDAALAEVDSTTSSEELVRLSVRECPTTGGRDTESCPAGKEEDAESSVDHDGVVITVAVRDAAAHCVVSGGRSVSWEAVDMASWTVCI